ncbi:uncharacterized protein DS421_9g269330 [Arachis hypogaea]|nr:uncharacterized protein DS421_9g269330 [Arachis hypogaea]
MNERMIRENSIKATSSRKIILTLQCTLEFFQFALELQEDQRVLAAVPLLPSSLLHLLLETSPLLIKTRFLPSSPAQYYYKR